MPSHPGHSYYKDFFFEDLDTSRAEIAEIIRRLAASFERLAATHERK